MYSPTTCHNPLIFVLQITTNIARRKKKPKYINNLV